MWENKAEENATAFWRRAFFFFFFFCSAAHAEVTLRLQQQQQPRTAEHQWSEGTEERERRLRRRLNSLFVSVDAAGNAAATVGASAGGGGGEWNLTSHTYTQTRTHAGAHGQTYAWIPTIFLFANAKGNMQRSFTLICTSLLGICLGSSLSFPSNINIGENGAYAAQHPCFLCTTCLVLLCLLCPALTPDYSLINRGVVPNRIARI